MRNISKDEKLLKTKKRRSDGFSFSLIGFWGGLLKPVGDDSEWKLVTTSSKSQY